MKLTTILPLLAAFAAGCGQNQPSGARDPLEGAAAGCNVLLITMDTTRADHLGCYGMSAAKTPNLDALAASGARFDACYSQAPITLVSHSTLMTGVYPPEHGVRDNGSYALGPELPVLAETFRKKGYRTGGFVACQVLDRRYGLQRGFEAFDDEMPEGPGGARFHDRPADRVCAPALAWLDEVASQRFFGWVHLFDPHAPYDPPEAYLAAADGSAYDGEISYMDQHVGLLLGKLREKGALDRTLVIAVADHGESLGDHGYDWHALLVYRGIMRVPLIISLPGKIQAGVATQVVGVVDMAPTIYALMGWKPPGAMSGRGLLPLLRGERLPPRAVYGESHFGYENFGWAKLQFVVDDDYHYIRAPEPELFDLRVDPGETSNLAATDRARRDQLEAALATMESEMRKRDAVGVALDAEAIESLRALGYVGGAGADPPPDAILPDPKKMIDVELAYRRAQSLLGFRQPMAVIEMMEPAVERSPHSFCLVELLGKAYAGAGMHEFAQATLLNALALNPRAADTWEFLARVLGARGDLPGAVRACRQALDLFPEHRIARESLAHLESEAEQQRTRIGALREQCAQSPGGEACLALGRELARAGEAPEALETLGRLQDSEARMTLAWLLATAPDEGLRDGPRAVRLARQAIETDGETPLALDTLAAALAETGEYDEAVMVAVRGVQQAASGDEALAASIERRMRLYRAGQAYHQPGAVDN